LLEINNFNHTYIFDNQVIFIPEKGLLTNDNKGVKCLLGVPANRCLLALVKYHGNVLSQNDLIEICWEERHNTVSSNAFYQLVLTLRKNLIEVGLEGEVIKTINRKGLLLVSSLSVEETTVIPPPDDLAKESAAQYQEKDIKVDSKADSEIDTENKDKIAIKIKKSIFFKKIKKYFFTCKMLCIVIIIANITMILNFSSEDILFGNYEKMAGNKNLSCSIYQPKEQITIISNIKLITEHTDLCEDGRSLFLTVRNFSQEISIFSCNKDARINSDAQCKGYIYTNNEN